MKLIFTQEPLLSHVKEYVKFKFHITRISTYGMNNFTCESGSNCTHKISHVKCYVKFPYRDIGSTPYLLSIVPQYFPDMKVLRAMLKYKQDKQAAYLL